MFRMIYEMGYIGNERRHTFYFPGKFKIEYYSDGRFNVFNNPNDLEEMTLELIERRKLGHMERIGTRRLRLDRFWGEMMDFFSRDDVDFHKEKVMTKYYLLCLFNFLKEMTKRDF